MTRPVLVLNADYRPLSWYPLSIISWQDAIRAIFSERVDIVEHYDEFISSPSTSIQLPSVIVLKNFVAGFRYPPFTRKNLYIRDMYECQYCGKDGSIRGLRKGLRLTMDHVYPKSRGGERSWENMVTCCDECNLKKADRTPKEARMPLINEPFRPNVRELWKNSRELQQHLVNIPEEWLTYLEPEE